MQTQERRILVVEDEEPIARSIDLCLELAGYTPYCVHNGAEALAAILKKGPAYFQMILTDLQMPVMSGLKLINELISIEVEIPIIVMSEFGTKEIIIELLQKGIKDFIDKPFQPSQLVQRIQHCFGKIKNKETIITSSPQEFPFLGQIKEDGKLYLLINQDDTEEYQKTLKNTLIQILEQQEDNVVIDLKNINEVNIILLNTLIGFAEAHRKKRTNGILEIINVSKDIYHLLIATDLHKSYQLQEA